jgi:uncharacterized protein YdgA (DUF945 family)
MRKIGIALVVVVVLGILATPLLGGIAAQKAHAVLVQNLGQIEASTMGTVRIADEGFELGWLSSKARMRVEVGPAGAGWTIPLLNVIHHGPLPVAHAARGFSMAFIDTTVEGAALADGKVPFQGETLIAMTGDVGIDLSSLALPRREDLAWEGGTARLRLGDQGKRVALQADAPRFEFHGVDGDVVLESLKVDYDAERSANGPALGTSTYVVGRARLTTPATQRSFSIDQLSWSSSSAYNPAGKLDSTYALRVAGLDVDETSYRDAALDLSLRNLDPAALQALSDLGQQLTQITTSGQPPEVMASQLQATLLQRVPMLLSSSPEIELKDAHVETLDGRIDADLRLTRDAEAAQPDPRAVQLEARLVLPLPTFSALLRRVAGEISPSARGGDTQVLDMISDRVAEQLFARGYIKEEEDGRLSSEISYSNDALALNGQVVNLGEVMMMATGVQTGVPMQ